MNILRRIAAVTLALFGAPLALGAVAADPATAALSSNSTVNSILHLPDGRTLVGGNLNGAGGTTAYSRLAIVGTDYRVSPTPAGTFNGSPTRLVRQADGKILVLGAFTEIAGIGGTGRTYLARLNADLTLDTTFLPPVPNNETTSAVVDAQGRIYLGGAFTLFGGQSAANYLVRLLPNGTYDPDFSITLNGGITDLVIQNNGQILVGGTFQTYGPSVGGSAVQSLIRLAADGTYDPDFTASYAPADAFGTGIKDLALDSQQRLLVASYHLGSSSPYGVFRLLPSGARDATFAFTETINNLHTAILPVAGDKILVGGNFTTYSSFFRLNENGSRDTAYTADLGTSFGASSANLRALASDATGRVWIGGGLTTFKGSTVNRLLVLQADALTPQTINFPALADRATNAAPFQLAATADSGLTVAYEISGPATLSGSTVTLTGTTGTVTITATQPGNATTAAAIPVIRSFTVATPFADFLSGAGVPANLRGPNDDADADGITNLMEYALALNPMANSAGQLPQTVNSGTHLTLTYRRVRSDVSYTVEAGDNPGLPWSAVNVSQGTAAGDGTTTATLPLTAPETFLRLRVTLFP